MVTMIDTRFTRDYGIQNPIALAPMAFVGTSFSLAIAACQAGCVGALAADPLPSEAVRALIKAVKDVTDGPLNVNFIIFLSHESQIQVCVDEDLSVVSFH